jgi:hypothetical protein
MLCVQGVALRPMLSDTQYHKNVTHGEIRKQIYMERFLVYHIQVTNTIDELKIALCKKRTAYIQMVALFISRH